MVESPFHPFGVYIHFSLEAKGVELVLWNDANDRVISMILPRDLRHFVVWNMANYFTLYYQPSHQPQLTLQQLPPFQRVTTPLPLRRTIGRCSWSLRNEESKGLGERLCMPYTIFALIINNITLTIVSSRNSVRVVLLIARGWRGTSLPRVSIHKEIQRRRCWAFSIKTW